MGGPPKARETERCAGNHQALVSSGEGREEAPRPLATEGKGVKPAKGYPGSASGGHRPVSRTPT